MGGEQGQILHLKIRQDHLPVHVGRHGGCRVPRLRERSAHLGGRRRLLRPSPPPPPPPGAEGLAGEPAGGPAGWRAGQRGRLGAHALGNLQAPGPPACSRQSPSRSRPDREVGLDTGLVLLSPARMRTGCDSAHPVPFSHGKTGGGGETERTSRRANATAASASSSRPPPPPLVGQHHGCRTFCLSLRSQSAALRLPRDCPSVKLWASDYPAGIRGQPAETPTCNYRSLKSRNRLFRFVIKQRLRDTASLWLGRGSESALHVVT